MTVLPTLLIDILSDTKMSSRGIMRRAGACVVLWGRGIPLLMVVAGCTPRMSTTNASAEPMAVIDTAPASVHWSRDAAEHRAIFLEVYAAASAQLERVAPTLTGSAWAAVLDADETTLDNSTYQLERARRGLGYSDESWNAWVRSLEASALPGAVAFTARVHALGGRVVIVSNRDESVCGETRRNLSHVGIVADLVLCAPAGQSDKNPRFRAIQTGAASRDVPALNVAIWIGDNIEDFPNLHQSIRTADEAALAAFGREYFLLPNPMYGSWVKNPSR